MIVADIKVSPFKDHFWHFQIKIKFGKKLRKNGSVRLPDAVFFWIIPCYLPSIWKDSITHMHGLAVYVKERLPFAQGLSLENYVESY